jgi:hypothetical protein
LERIECCVEAWADPEIEYVWADGPSPGSWKGVAAAGEGFRGWMSAWEGFRLGVDEYRELDDGRVLALNHSIGRGKRSGLELRQMPTAGAMLFHVRCGQVARLVAYIDRDRALADLGLEE